MKRFVVLSVLLAAFCVPVSAQSRLFGKIVEIVDGRTVTMETSAGRVTVRLQFIEVPEPEQPLHTVVREHLARFAVEQTAELVAVRSCAAIFRS